MRFNLTLIPPWFKQDHGGSVTGPAVVPARPAVPSPGKVELTPEQQDAVDALTSMGMRRNEAPRAVLMAVQAGVPDNAQEIVTHVLRNRK